MGSKKAIPIITFMGMLNLIFTSTSSPDFWIFFGCTSDSSIKILLKFSFHYETHNPYHYCQASASAAFLTSSTDHSCWESFPSFFARYLFFRIPLAFFLIQTSCSAKWTPISAGRLYRLLPQTSFHFFFWLFTWLLLKGNEEGNCGTLGCTFFRRILSPRGRAGCFRGTSVGFGGCWIGGDCGICRRVGLTGNERLLTRGKLVRKDFLTFWDYNSIILFFNRITGQFNS